MSRYKLRDDDDSVLRDDGSTIPKDSGNADYQDYLRWKAEGNTPDAADPVRPPPTNRELLDLELANPVRVAIYLALALDGPFADIAALRAAIRARL